MGPYIKPGFTRWAWTVLNCLARITDHRRRIKMANVTINKIRKSYDGLEVIHGLDIDIADGEFVALVGPSGCGKSTVGAAG